MIRVTHEIGIQRTMAEVFEFLEDPANYPAWQVVMSHIVATNEMREGSLVTYTRTSEMGDSLTSTIRITKNNGFDLMESVSVRGPLENIVRLSLKPDGPAATLFRVDIISKPIAAMPPDSETALEYIIDARTEADAARLKQVLEGPDAWVIGPKKSK